MLVLCRLPKSQRAFVHYDRFRKLQRCTLRRLFQFEYGTYLLVSDYDNEFDEPIGFSRIQYAQ